MPTALEIINSNIYCSVTMCMLDFIRKIEEHSKLRQLIFKLVCGKFAYREYELAKINLEVANYPPDFPYGLEDCDYHKKTYKEIRDGGFREKEELIKKYG